MNQDAMVFCHFATTTRLTSVTASLVNALQERPSSHHLHLSAFRLVGVDSSSRQTLMGVRDHQHSIFLN